MFVLMCFRLGRFLQAVVEERPVGEGDASVLTEDIFGSSGEGGLTPLDLNWEELTYSKAGIKVYEHSGAKPTPHSTYRLRYARHQLLTPVKEYESHRLNVEMIPQIKFC